LIAAREVVISSRCLFPNRNDEVF